VIDRYVCLDETTGHSFSMSGCAVGLRYGFSNVTNWVEVTKLMLWAETLCIASRWATVVVGDNCEWSLLAGDTLPRVPLVAALDVCQRRGELGSGRLTGPCSGDPHGAPELGWIWRYSPLTSWLDWFNSLAYEFISSVSAFLMQFELAL